MSSLAPRAPIRRTLRVLRPLLWAALVIGVLGLAGAVFVTVDTNVLWFDSVGYSDVYVRRLWTEVVMVLLFGGVTAAVLGVTTWLAARLQPVPSAEETTSRIRARWDALSTPTRVVLLSLIPVIGGLRAGVAAASHWQLWFEWRNAVSFGVTDPRFHRDYSYYVDVYPLHRYVVTAAASLITIALVSVGVVAWLRGAIQLRGGSPRFSLPLRRIVAVLLAVLALVKAAAYWLDRFSTVVSSRGVTTGQSFVDLHVVLPVKLGLLVVSILLAAGFVLAAVRRSAKGIVSYVAVMVVVGVLAGGVVPSLVQTFAVKPSAVTAEATSISRNIAATRYGFGVDVPAQPAGTASAPPSAAPASQASAVRGAVQPRLIDPNVVSPTFTQLQQQASYYGFAPTLDVDRYDIGGAQTDEVVGVRELRGAGVASKTWANQHLVYTHGLGVVAAPTAAVTGNGQPSFNEEGLPSHGALESNSGRLQQRIYFGKYSPSYSIVGAPAGQGREFDQPGKPADYSYQGTGGVPIGSTWRQLLFALRLRDKNLFFSSSVTADSRLLYLRSPAARIAAVAPWLTVDGDIYPVVAGGHVTWIADGYTTSSLLPDSQEENLRSGTLTTYNRLGSASQQASTPVNYIRNSVVATVDAYTGAVNLYQKPGAAPDPLLQTWMRSFPGLVKPASQFPADLRPHLRYPQDLFNLQRYVLASYHVTDPAVFYSRQQVWRVPGDPTVGPSVPQPSYYATTTAADGGQQFTLTSPMLSNNGLNIAAYLSVDCDEGTPDYGRLQVSTVPQQQQTESPRQLLNDIESNPRINHRLTTLRLGQSAVKVGNLQTLQVDGNVLAIEPVYAQRVGGGNYPLLRYVVVVYGSGQPGFAKTFGDALAQALNVSTHSTSVATLTANAKTALQQYRSAEASGNKAAAAAALSRLGQLLNEIQSAGG